MKKWIIILLALTLRSHAQDCCGGGGGGSGSATNAVDTIFTNGVAVKVGGVTNINFQQHSGNSLTGGVANFTVTLGIPVASGSAATGMLTNQFTTNVVGTAIVGNVNFGNTTTTVSNLTVNGTQTVATANVTNLVLINPFDISLGTNGNYNAHTNIWTADTPFILGQTNYVLLSGAATLGITGVANLPTSGSRFGELSIKTSGTVVFTNAPGIYASDGLTSRTLTNDSVNEFSLKVVAGVYSNLLIVKSWKP